MAVKSNFGYFMDKAFEMAEFALEHQEVPVGCVIEHKGKIIARGCNEVNISKNATRHAEMVAIDQIIEEAKIRGIPLAELCDSSCVYVTVEPCIMCVFALRMVGLKTVIHGCQNERFGGCGSVLNIHQATLDPLLEQLHCSAASDEHCDRAKSLLKQFYDGNNPNTSQQV